MKPGERVRLIKRLAAALAKLDWDELDLTLRQFGLPWSRNWPSGDHESYAVAHIEDATDGKLLELEEYLFPATGPTPGATERAAADPGKALWTKGLFRLFLSHTSKHKEELAQLKPQDARPLRLPAGLALHRLARASLRSPDLLPAVVLRPGYRQASPLALAEPAPKRTDRRQLHQRVLLLAREQFERIPDQRR